MVFTSVTRWAMASARRPRGSSMAARTSWQETVFSIPRISTYTRSSLLCSACFISSAVWKSTKKARISASVISSPAMVAMV